MKKIILFAMLLMVSCQADNLCEVANELISEDQSFRKNNQKYLSTEFYFLDSLLRVGGHSRGIDELSSIDKNEVKLLRNVVDSLSNEYRQNNLSKIDSLWVTLRGIDDRNTSCLLRLITNLKINNLEHDELSCLDDALIVFVHSPRVRKKEIIHAIESIDLENLNRGRFNHIMRHLNHGKE